MAHNGTAERIVDFYWGYCLAHGYAPFYREVADAVGLSSATTVKWYVDALVAEGELMRAPGQIRGVWVVCT